MAVVFRDTDEARTGSFLDRAGICVSAACLAQCVALTLAIVLAPVVSLGFFGSDLFHRLLLILIVPVSLSAFVMGYRAHGSAGLLLAGAVGLLILLLAVFLEATVLTPLAASLLTSIGGVVLITAHWFNLRRRRSICLQPR